MIAHGAMSSLALIVDFSQIWLSIKWKEIKFIEILAQLLCMVSLMCGSITPRLTSVVLAKSGRSLCLVKQGPNLVLFISREVLSPC